MIIEHVDRPYGDNKFEIVERKGLGHPDTLCDGISDAVSRALCNYYLGHFGRILHHNADKVLIIAGRSSPEFGGGSTVRPLSVVIGGRATDEFEGSRIPTQDIAREATERYLRSTLKHIGDDFVVEPRLGSGSAELRSLVKRISANDTSIGVGYAPLSTLERNALDAEALARTVKGAGEDVKVMALRNEDRVAFTISTAILSSVATDMAAYDGIKSDIRQKAAGMLSSSWKDASVAVNAADTDNNIYLTITGTSAEMGDDGETGRGNRANGLITPGRPMTLEAQCGKNPVNHVGKIYNLLAIRAARDITSLEGIEEAYVYIVSKIGAPLDKPQLKAARILGKAPEKKIEYAIDYWLERIPQVTEEFIKGEC